MDDLMFNGGAEWWLIHANTWGLLIVNHGYDLSRLIDGSSIGTRW